MLNLKKILYGKKALSLLETKQELKKHIQELKNFIVDSGDGWVTYNITGSVRGNALLSLDDIAVQEIHIPKGEQFPEHCHPNCLEWVVVKCGKLKYIKNGKNNVLHAGDWDVIGRSGEPHSGIALRDTVALAVSIPRDKGFPYGKISR